MNILFVSGHPAQVHNFRLVREELIKDGHNVYWLTTPKDIATNLLDIYGIPYSLLKKPDKAFFSRMSVMVRNVIFVIHFLRRNNIDIVISRTCPYTSVAAFLIRKKHVILDDTEHGAKLCKPFSNLVSTVLVPDCFNFKLRKDEIRFAGNIELFYTHKNRFVLNPPYDILGISEGTKYAIVRFVKWNAYHDTKLEGGFTLEHKVELVNKLAKHLIVFISSEDGLPVGLEKYRIRIPLERMHDVLACADMIVGESATMASESVMLGTPAIYVDQVGRGYTDEEAEAGLLYMYRPGQQNEAIAKAVELVSSTSYIQDFNHRRESFLSKKIDTTAWLTWFIENYPESESIMRKNPDSQFVFR